MDLISATGSPPSSRMFSNVRFAPISISVSNIPFRVGFKLIFGTRTSDFSTISAEQIIKAAEDGSQGIWIFCGLRSGYPQSTVFQPVLVLSVEITAPNLESIRSVWSRVITDSVNTVSPAVFKPANKTADFT